MDLREVFAINLRRLRNAKGLSQDGLAHESGISRSYLSQIEKGSFNVSLKVIGKLAETLHVEPGEFLKGRIQRGGVSKTPDINVGSEEEV
jgi:transcriptional regulator with XRE-family HTH domain